MSSTALDTSSLKNPTLSEVKPQLAPALVSDAAPEADLHPTRFETRQNADNLRSTILNLLAAYRYDAATQELKLYQQHKSQQSAYHLATIQLFNHAVEIVSAMKNLNEANDLATLPRAKRQDTLGRIRRLFDNVKSVLVRLEQIENDLIVKDTRSVVWFVQSCAICMFVIIAVGAFVEAVTTLGRPLEVMSIEISNHVLKFLGL